MGLVSGLWDSFESLFFGEILGRHLADVIEV
jgi:hypothetical protein